MTCLGTNPLIVVKSGEIISFVFPTGTNQNFQYQEWTCDDAGTGAPALYNGFTSGEIVNSVFLFWIFSLLLFGGIILWIRGVKIKQ